VGVRILRTPIFHEATFWALTMGACRGQGCLLHRGQYWEEVERQPGFAVYRASRYNLGWLQERLEDYEVLLYGQLLAGHFGRDGRLRPRSQVRQDPGRGYRRGPRAVRRVA